jgi:hypothetical protein
MERHKYHVSRTQPAANTTAKGKAQVTILAATSIVRTIHAMARRRTLRQPPLQAATAKDPKRASPQPVKITRPYITNHPISISGHFCAGSGRHRISSETHQDKESAKVAAKNRAVAVTSTFQTSKASHFTISLRPDEPARHDFQDPSLAGGPILIAAASAGKGRSHRHHNPHDGVSHHP